MMQGSCKKVLTQTGLLRLNENKTETLTFRSSLIPMRLHRHMRVQVIECAVCFLTTLPATLVHSLDLFISATGALVLLGTGNRNEGIDLLMGEALVRHTT